MPSAHSSAPKSVRNIANPPVFVRCGKVASMVAAETANPIVDTSVSTRTRLGADADLAAYEKATRRPIVAPMRTMTVAVPAGILPAMRAAKAATESVAPAPAMIASRRSLLEVNASLIDHPLAVGCSGCSAPDGHPRVDADGRTLPRGTPIL